MYCGVFLYIHILIDNLVFAHEMVSMLPFTTELSACCVFDRIAMKTMRDKMRSTLSHMSLSPRKKR